MAGVNHDDGGLAPERGLFIVVEGIEASGKSTLVAGLAPRLTATGYDVVVTREPGGTPFGSRARAIFLEPGLSIDPLAEVFLLSASRAQLVAEVIRPALGAGRVVISDRFSMATIAYQGAGRGLDTNLLAAVAKLATGGLAADATLLVDVPVAVSRARVASRTAATGVASDRIEREDASFHERVRAGYLSAAAAGAGVRVLDGTLPPESLLEAALAELAALGIRNS